MLCHIDFWVSLFFLLLGKFAMEDCYGSDSSREHSGRTFGRDLRE